MEQITAGEIVVETSGFFTRRHRMMAGSARLGDLTIGLGSAVSFVDGQGRQVRMGRAARLSGTYEMWAEGQARASARGIFPRGVEIQFGGARFLLQPASRFRDWELATESGDVLLTVGRGGWGQPPWMTVHAPLALELLAFAYFLALMQWRAARLRNG
ncbi:MAG: hypothetical protein JW900_04345 [Anaerolineae bacterium]|nr:hypothetical protein [Anaerolineae bacterium]